MALLWSFNDQQTYKPISENNEQKWEQLATEVQQVKLREMMGDDFYHDLIQNPSTTANAKLIDGGTYSKDGVTYEFLGLKAVLSFLFFERYIKEIDVQDTFNGFMRSDNINAEHVSFGQKKNIAMEAKRVADIHWKDIKDFVCENSDDYPYSKFTRSNRFSFF